MRPQKTHDLGHVGPRSSRSRRGPVAHHAAVVVLDRACDEEGAVECLRRPHVELVHVLDVAPSSGADVGVPKAVGYGLEVDALGEQEEYAIGFRKNDCALRDKVQSIISEMKADGKLAEISTKWFGSDITTVK